MYTFLLHGLYGKFPGNMSFNPETVHAVSGGVWNDRRGRNTMGEIIKLMLRTGRSHDNNVS